MNPSLSIDPAVLVPAAKVLLLGTFGIGLASATHEGEGLELPFERLIVAVLGLAFAQKGAAILEQVSSDLVAYLKHLGDKDDLRTLILNAFKEAPQTPAEHGTTGFNAAALMEQAWRTGLWGILGTIVQWLFMLSWLLLETGHAVLWKLLLIFFPLACGFHPIFPRMLVNLTIYAIELTLWLPTLMIVDRVTTVVARTYMLKAYSWGLYLVAVEIFAALLILGIPSITHRFLGGAFAGDFGAGPGLIETGKKWVVRAQVWDSK